MKYIRISIILLSAVLWGESEAFVPYEGNKPCPILDTINITNGEIDRHGNIAFEGLVYAPSEYGVYDYEINVQGVLVQAKPHTRGCLCRKKPCLRMCCPKGQIANENEKGCADHPEHELFLNASDDEQETVRFHLQSNKYGILYQKPCKKMYAVTPQSYDEDKWYFLKNGSILLEDGKVADHKSYCFGNMMELNETKVTSELLFCFIDNIELRYHLYPIGMIISIPFLVITFLVYGLISELRNLHGKSLMCYVANLIVLYICLSTVQIYKNEQLPGSWCEIFGYLVYLTVLFCFFWLNVMCIDIYSTFKGSFRERGGSAELKRFLQYCAYAFGVPLVLLLVVFVMDQMELPKTIKPDMGIDSCFMKGEVQQFIYMYFPISIILVVNIVLYSITAFKIFTVQKETMNMKNGESQKHSNVDDKDRFFLYLRLFIVMGITWVAESISFMFSGSIVFYVTDILNSLQGFVIFILFVWKPKVKKLIMRRYRSIRKLPPTSSMMASRVSRTESSRISTSLKRNSEKILLSEHC